MKRRKKKSLIQGFERKGSVIRSKGVKMCDDSFEIVEVDCFKTWNYSCPECKEIVGEITDADFDPTGKVEWTCPNCGQTVQAKIEINEAIYNQKEPCGFHV